jgi:hypothetical protein
VVDRPWPTPSPPEGVGRRAVDVERPDAGPGGGNPHPAGAREMCARRHEARRRSTETRARLGDRKLADPKCLGRVERRHPRVRAPRHTGADVDAVRTVVDEGESRVDVPLGEERGRPAGGGGRPWRCWSNGRPAQLNPVRPDRDQLAARVRQDAVHERRDRREGPGEPPPKGAGRRVHRDQPSGSGRFRREDGARCRRPCRRFPSRPAPPAERR